jgi:putative NIF3 family GTP cyclohydrolase 1 type 2
MRAAELQDHMRKIGTWVDWESTCDRFIIGDPETEVKGIAVAWQARLAALREAVNRGCNLFVTHEPVFYRHMDDDEIVFSVPHVREKKAFIEENGLVIFRCHDVWDRMPEIGIVDSWAKQLGLSNKLGGDGFHSVYPSPAIGLRRLAEYVLSKTRDLGQDSVEMVGDPNATITNVGIGCGAITRYEAMVNLGADAIIGTDDGMSYWNGGSWALDGGISLVIVNHCTAEEPGMHSLAEYIRQEFPEVRTEFISQGCMFRTVS